MVFRIRDKSLFWTKSGWKNNWEPKILNMPKPINSANTQYVTCRFDHHSFLRSIPSITQLSKPIEIFPAPAGSTFTETQTPSSSSSLNSAISLSCPSIARLQLSSSKTAQYCYNKSGKKICRSDR
jgi:hypothetical protein